MYQPTGKPLSKIPGHELERPRRIINLLTIANQASYSLYLTTMQIQATGSHHEYKLNCFNPNFVGHDTVLPYYFEGHDTVLPYYFKGWIRFTIASLWYDGLPLQWANGVVPSS